MAAGAKFLHDRVSGFFPFYIKEFDSGGVGLSAWSSTYIGPVPLATAMKWFWKTRQFTESSSISAACLPDGYFVSPQSASYSGRLINNIDSAKQMNLLLQSGLDPIFAGYLSSIGMFVDGYVGNDPSGVAYSGSDKVSVTIQGQTFYAWRGSPVVVDDLDDYYVSGLMIGNLAVKFVAEDSGPQLGMLGLVSNMRQLVGNPSSGSIPDPGTYPYIYNNVLSTQSANIDGVSVPIYFIFNESFSNFETEGETVSATLTGFSWEFVVSGSWAY